MKPSIRLDASFNRRARHRIPCRTPVRIYVDQTKVADSYTLTAADLSSDGVFLRSNFLYPVGETLELEYVVPGVPLPVRAKGKVVRVEDRDTGQGPGMAVELLS